MFLKQKCFKPNLYLLLILKALLSRQQLNSLMIVLSQRQRYFERHLFQQIMQKSEETIDRLGRLHQRAINCEFGENENDYIREVIDKCYLSKLCWKFLEKEEALMWDDLWGRRKLLITSWNSMALTKWIINWLTKWMQLVTSWMEMRALGKDRNALVTIKKDISVEFRMCSVIGHFRVKCPQARQCCGDGCGFRGDKDSKGADDGRRKTGSKWGNSRGRHVVVVEAKVARNKPCGWQESH